MRKNLVALFGLLVACSGGATGRIDPERADNTGTGPTEPGVVIDDGTILPTSVTAKLAADVDIAEIAIFQGVKATIVKAGAKTKPGVPLVAARDALVRVYVAPTKDYEARPLKAVLRVVDADGEPLNAFTDEKTLKAASTDSAIDSTFNFRVPGSALPLGARLAVAITDEDASEIDEGEESPARYPADGSEIALDLQSAGPSLRVVVVPVKYMYDGSGRLPDTSPAQLQRQRDGLFGVYPIPDVEITVRSPFTWTRQIRGSGQGWGALLQALVDLREQDGVDDDVYYWGAFSAAPSQSSFCGSGCVMGLSTLVTDPRDSYFRASIGVGYAGDDSVETMVHELGHAHGRGHAPCSSFGSIEDVDPRFPHSGGRIGVWGFDLVANTLVSPTQHADFMGYCDRNWVSDYTYKALFERIALVNRGKEPMPAPTPGDASSPGEYQFIEMGAEGPAGFGQSVSIRKAPQGGVAREVELLDERGARVSTLQGKFFEYSHIPGGLMLVPTSKTPYKSLRVAGFRKTISR